MNILLVYPEMPDTFYAMKHLLHIVGKKAVYPPLGLLTISSLLPEHWERKLWDLNARSLTQKELAWADLVFLSAMNVQERSVREIIILCKEAGVPIVAGGPLFTHEFERFPGIDHFVLNEAEITLPQFLEDWEKGNPQAMYSSKEFANVVDSPLPDFALANMDHYLFSIVQYSRGCPYMCDFCDVTALFGRRPRTKTSTQIIQELEAIHAQKNVSLVLFADDNLIGNKKILKNDLLPALIEWRKKRKPGFFFATQLTINLADDPELMHLLTEAGFRHVFIGIETPDEAGLLGSLKKQNLKRNQLENIRKLHQAGFIIAGGFIVGFDTDTSSIFEQQANFIQESGIPLPIVNILKAPPGTALFDRIKKEGRLSKDFAFAEGDTNIVPNLPEDLLFPGFLELITNIYHPKASYERLKEFFTTYRAPKTQIKVPEVYGWADVKMFLRMLFLLGILSRDRKYFWKLVIWTYFHQRKNLDKALFYGIMIHQMHKTYDYITQSVIEENPHVFDREGEKEMYDPVMVN